MAYRIRLPGRSSFVSLSLTKRMRLNTTKCFSMSLNRGTDDPSATTHPTSSPQQTHSEGSVSKDTRKVGWKEFNRRASQDVAMSIYSSLNPGHTLFTSPSATKETVLDMVETMRVPAGFGNAVVILASPRHASWVTDPEFMTGLVLRLLRKKIKVHRHHSSWGSFHTLTAVVDGLHPRIGSTEMQEGLSLQFGDHDRLLPGLWDDPSAEMSGDQTRPLNPESESAHVSVVLNKSTSFSGGQTVTLPLANTLFHNGQRTTLIATKWEVDSFKESRVSLSKMLPKQSQKIDLSVSNPLHDGQEIRMLCPLVPITPPREIVEGLGNILARVDIDGEAVPASKELQVNIPLLLQARQSRPEYDPKSARVGVWALNIPKPLFADRNGPHKSSTRDPISTFNMRMRMGRLKGAIGKLAFEMESVMERMAWKHHGIMGEILLRGGRLHQILSGGGEWGAKASLLSLDPQISYGKESEEDELDRFQRSFLGEDTACGAIARPGDYVQFFVHADPDLPKPRARYPSSAFGVGEFSEEGYTTATVDASTRPAVQLVVNHFGAFTAEGMYLEMWHRSGRGPFSEEKRMTKVNVPGTIMYP